MRRILPLLALLAACDGGEKPPGKAPDALEPVCARPTASDPITGDANGDGVLDIADGVYTLRWLLVGGHAPACAGKLDVIDDDDVDVADGLATWYHLFVGNTTIPGRIRDECGEPSGVTEGACGELLVDVAAIAPAAGSGAVQATVRITSPTLRADAWSLSVKAEGCSITAATTAGTAAADTRLESVGRRDRGWENTAVVSGGVVSATVLSWRYDKGLEPSSDPVAVLSLTVEGEVPSSGCTTCTITPDDGLTGEGEAVSNVVTVAGLSYMPTLRGTEVEICAAGSR